LMQIGNKMQMAKIPERLRSSITCKFFKMCLNTSKMSDAYHQCVHKNCAKFEECQPKGVRGVDYMQSRYCLFKHARKMSKHFQKFNVSITTMQSLENVNLKE
jgi:hypothetical protein